MRRLMRAAACGLVGGALIVGDVMPAISADDADPTLDKRIMDKVMGTLGLKTPADIDYKERSPLVLPPRINLPAPQANATTQVPNWPVDPDAKRRREESNRRRDEVEESRPLRPNELNVGQRTRNQDPAPTQEQIDGRPERPTAGGGLFGGKKQEGVKFTQEPARSSLTEPPVGYQTPSPNQPYTAKEDRWLPQIPTFNDFGTAQK